MKILLLSDANSVHTFRWAKSLNAKNFDIHIFSLFSPSEFSLNSYNKLNIKVTSAGLETKIKEHRKLSLRKIYYLKSFFILKKTIRKFKPHLLHAHYASSYGLIGFLSRFKPLILSVWGSDIYYFPKKNIITRILLKLVLKNVDELCSTSNAMKKIIEKEYSNLKINVIPFGIDTKLFKPNKDLKKKFVVGTIKSIEDYNGIDCFLNAIKIVLHQFNINISFLIVGDGSMKKKMELKAIDLGINKSVRFIGHVPHDQVISYYNRLSLFIAVSTRESFGVSILEAGACEIPSITSNIGGLTEVNKNNFTGIVIDPDDANKLAHSIVRLYKDESLRKELGQNARRRVIEKYDWDDNVNQMIKIYKKYIGSK